jgi:mannose-6-phosphate isomerase-like protein (cupin superfamily)
MSPNQTGKDAPAQGKSARFDVTAIAASFPPTASTLLIDRYLTNREAASARIFRVYKPTPPHYHATCDEYLFVLSGRGTFWMEDPTTKAEFAPGNLLFFERGTVHALPDLLEEPVMFLSVDTPAPRADGHHLRQPRRRHARHLLGPQRAAVEHVARRRPSCGDVSKRCKDALAKVPVPLAFFQ